MKKTILSFILFFLFLPTVALQLPLTEINPETTYVHNRVLVDNYAWLKDKARTDPQVLAHLEAENEFTSRYLESNLDLQQTLYKEFISRTDYDDSSIPVKIDSFYYYNRIEKGKDYNILCRKKEDLTNSEEIILDENELSSGKDYFNLKDFEISPDHHLVAYTVDYKGFEDYQLFIKDLNTGQIIETFTQPIDGVVWAADSRTILYTTTDESGRSDRIFRHELFSDKDDELIFVEQDKAFYIWLQKSRSKKFIILTSYSNTTSEVWIMNCSKPQSGFDLLQPRKQGMEYYVYDHGDEFYIRTNADGAYNFKIMTTPVNSPGKENWQEFIPHRDSVYLDFAVFHNFLVRIERKNGVKTISLTDHNNKLIKELTVDEPFYMIYQGNNPDYFTTTYRYDYESLRTPFTSLEFDLQTGSTAVLKIKNIDNYSPEKYSSAKLFAQADDGTEIPISILYREDTITPAGNPLLLDGYGAYGDSGDPYFSSSRISLLDRGVIFAVAHVRGGGDLGYQWYKAGKMSHKMNTFTDFIACAEFLIKTGYTTNEQLVIQGGSAGGLLIGAVLNMRPDLCKAAVADVPFVDVINSMLDPTLSATVLEYEEWGNPNIENEFEYIYSYCPYQNVTAQEYPDLLAIGGFYDSRVNYWEPAKWIAKIREKKTDDNVQLLYIYMDSGHGGTSGKLRYYQEVAFKFAYILNELNIKE